MIPRLTLHTDNSNNELKLGTDKYLRGKDGKSAYEIWLEEGNVGTGEDFLNSLKGADGKDGYTPIKGTDYFTEADKAEIVAETVENIPTASADTKGLVKVGDGLKMNGDVLSIENGKYTLVHEVTTTEAINALIYNCDSAKLYYEVTTPATNEDSNGIGVLDVNEFNHFVYYDTMTMPTQRRLCRAKVYVENGLMCIKDFSQVNADNNWGIDYGTGYRYFYTTGGYFTNKITSIKLALTSDRLFPIGTVFKVYEVKA